MSKFSSLLSLRDLVLRPLALPILRSTPRKAEQAIDLGPFDDQQWRLVARALEDANITHAVGHTTAEGRCLLVNPNRAAEALIVAEKIVGRGVSMCSEYSHSTI